MGTSIQLHTLLVTLSHLLLTPSVCHTVYSGCLFVTWPCQYIGQLLPLTWLTRRHKYAQLEFDLLMLFIIFIFMYMEFVFFFSLQYTVLCCFVFFLLSHSHACAYTIHVLTGTGQYFRDYLESHDFPHPNVLIGLPKIKTCQSSTTKNSQLRILFYIFVDTQGYTNSILANTNVHLIRQKSQKQRRYEVAIQIY